MTDVFLSEFYNDVRDPAWPLIRNLRDWHLLSDDIKQECTSSHNFDQRLDEITNPDYWISQTTEAYRLESVAFVPVYKAASSYYRRLFVERLGWTPTNLGSCDKDDVLFGLVIDPWARYLKGLAQFIWQMNLSDIANLDAVIERLLIPDIHTAPYHVIFGKWLHQIRWVPLDLVGDRQTKLLIQRMLNNHGIKIEIPLDDARLNQSDHERKRLAGLAEHALQNKPRELFTLYKFLASDLRFYHNLAGNFDPETFITSK